MAEHEWDERGALARAGLAPLHFLRGSWMGGGHSEGEPVQATLQATLCFEDTVLEVRERLCDPRGALRYEDVSFYRYDPVARQIKVLQISAPAWTTEQIVQPEPRGLRWYGGPFAPRVELRLGDDDATLSEQVFAPEAQTPAVALRYRRA